MRWAIPLVVVLVAAFPGTPVRAQAVPDAAQIVTHQFGSAFTLVAGLPPLIADLDGDGAEDLVIVATSKDPLTDQLDFHYKVIDPYDAYFGFGDPKVTAQFAASEPGPPRVLLLVHDWHAATPKSKFVVINLPFETVSLGRRALKKKVVPSISLSDRTGLNSDLYWTGKQWKWVERSLSME